MGAGWGPPGRGRRARGRPGREARRGRRASRGRGSACRPVAARSAATMAGVAATTSRLADALRAVRHARLRHLDELRHDRRHVERRRDQVVGERGVAHAARRRAGSPPSARGPTPCAAPPSTWPCGALRVHHPADVLRRGDLDDPHEAELLVHLDDGALGDEGEGDVDVALPLGVEPVGGAMVVYGVRRDRALREVAAAPRRSSSRTRRHAPGRPRRSSWSAATPTSSRPTRRSCRPGPTTTSSIAELGAGDLRQHRLEPLAEVHGGGVDAGDRAVGPSLSVTVASAASSKPSL